MPEIQTNNGLHGNMLFYEMDYNLQFTVTSPEILADRAAVMFTYTSHDSDEGEVHIRYVAISGDVNDSDGWDVEVSTGSDVWDLERHQQAINEAIRLHRYLGHHRRFEP